MEFIALEDVSLSEATAIWNDAFVDYIVPITLSEQQLAQRIENYHLSPEHSTIIKVEGEYAGIMLFGAEEVNNEKLTWIGGMAVKPQFRGYGLARALVAKAITMSQELDAERLLLEVILGNDKAEALYHATNFLPINELFVGSKILAATQQANITLQPTIVEARHMKLQSEETAWQNLLNKEGILADIYVLEQWVGYVFYTQTADTLVLKQLVLQEPTQALVEAVLSQLYKKYGAVQCIASNLPIACEETQFLQEAGFQQKLRQQQMFNRI